MSRLDADHIEEFIRRGTEDRVTRAKELAVAREKLQADRERHAAEDAANVKAVEDAEKRARAAGLDTDTLVEIGLIDRPRGRRRATKNSARGVRRAAAGRGTTATQAPTNVDSSAIEASHPELTDQA